MSVIDSEKLLEEVSPGEPCGEDLEYDADFRELNLAAEGTPERQKGGTIIPAVPPDWRDVQKRSLALFPRAKDIRVAVLLARAVLHSSGLPAFADALGVLRAMLERYWDGVYPRLDPDDDNDPTMRVNAIVALCDGETMLRDLRDTPLVSSRALGRFSLRDILIAKGELPPPANAGDSLPGAATIDGAFSDIEPAEIQATADAVRAAMGHVMGIEAHVTDQVGTSNAPNLADLVHVLRDMQRVLGEQLARRGLGAGAAAPGEGGDAAGLPAGGAAGAPAPARAAAPGAAISGDIASREDVIRFIDKACEYYKRYEPSSPVPLLLLRARRLVTMDFMDILRDLAPDGLPQATTVTGADRES